MNINSVSNQQHQQSFGMAIYADHNAIKRLSKFVQNDEKSLFRLNDIIASQKYNPIDAFLSTDNLGKLTARIGFSENIHETDNPMKIVEEVAKLANGIKNRMLIKSSDNLVSTLEKKGQEAAIKQVMNKLAIDV